MVTKIEKGRLAEVRFFEVVRADGIAPWFCGIEPANAHLDAHGIDAIATIRRQVSAEQIRVPVQVKSSTGGVAWHLLRHPEHWRVRIVFVVISDETTDSSICRQLRARLQHPRTHGYTYEDFFRQMEAAYVPQFQTKLMEALADRRSQHRS